MKNYDEKTVGDLFTYKNRLFLNIVFRSVLSHVYFTQQGLMLTIN